MKKNNWNSVGIDRSWWEWMGVGGSGWEWMGVGRSGWECVGVGESGWEWMGVGGSGWEWVGALFSKVPSLRYFLEECSRRNSKCGMLISYLRKVVLLHGKMRRSKEII